jgi:ParB-like chromosome segregation protein Spo0J
MPGSAPVAGNRMCPYRVRPNERGYDAIAGIHRLEAAKQLDWTMISCIVLHDIDADQAELIEIDENLIRAELSPAERSMHIGKRKKLYEKLHPETRATKVGGPGRAKTRRQIGDDIAERFTKDTAKKSNRPERSVQRDATRAKKVVVLPDIVGTSLDNGAELDALAKLPEVEQRSLAAAAKRGEQVSAITMPETPADPKSDVIGEVRSTLVPKLDPLAWTISTLEERIEFIKAIGRRDIEAVFDAIEPMAPVQATRSAMAREPAEPGAVTPEKFETQNNPREEAGYDGKLDPRLQKEVRGTTLEIVPEHVAQNPAPKEETDGERHIRLWHEAEQQYRDRVTKEAQEFLDSQVRKRNRAAGWPCP